MTLYLLGPPRLESEDAPVELGRRKAMALLAYLVVTGQSHSRDALATLFWPKLGQSQARANLRRSLFDLHQLLGDCIDAERETVRYRSRGALWVDVQAFRQLKESDEADDHASELTSGEYLARLSQAVELYHNDLLFGFNLPDCREFDQWQFIEGEQLRGELRSVLTRLIKGLGEAEKYEQALGFARRLLALDPLEEAAHRELMRLYAMSGQPAAALRQYRECVRVLKEELDAVPEEETGALLRDIKQKRLKPKRVSNLAEKNSKPIWTKAEIRLVTVLVTGLSPAADRIWESQLGGTEIV